MTELLKGPMFRLNVVIMSSLALLAFGLRTPSGTIEVLQLPVAFMQVYFISAVLLQVGWQGFVAPLTRIQLGLVAMLVFYVGFVSLLSPVASAGILAISWIIHILFFVALIAFFETNEPRGASVVWTALGLTALVHVGAFLFAWALWPDEIRQMNLPVVGNIRHLTYFLTPAAAVMAIRFIMSSDRASSSIVFFAAPAFFIIYTGSRAAAIGVTIALLVAGIYSIRQRENFQLRRVLVLAVLIAFLVVLAELLPPLPWDTIAGRWFEAFSASGPEFTSARNEAWPLTIKAISQNWVWGYGPALQHEIPHQTPWPDRLPLLYQPHNIGLQLLLHWGALGTLIIAFTILSFSSNILKALRYEPARAIFPFGVLIAMFTQALVDGNLFYPFSVAIAIVAFALLESIGRQRAHQLQHGK